MKTVIAIVIGLGLIMAYREPDILTLLYVAAVLPPAFYFLYREGQL